MCQYSMIFTVTGFLSDWSITIFHGEGKERDFTPRRRDDLINGCPLLLSVAAQNLCSRQSSYLTLGLSSTQVFKF